MDGRAVSPHEPNRRQRSWVRRLPGYRSGRPWKMALACLVYPAAGFLALVLLTAALIPLCMHLDTETNQNNWQSIAVTLNEDAQAHDAAIRDGNASDLALAEQALAKHCHEAEGYVHLAGNSDEQAVRAFCAKAGFALPAASP